MVAETEQRGSSPPDPAASAGCLLLTSLDGYIYLSVEAVVALSFRDVLKRNEAHFAALWSRSSVRFLN